MLIAVALRVPTDDSSHSQRILLIYEGSTTYLHLRHSRRRVLTLGNPPEEAAEAKLTYMSNYSAKIQRGSSTLMDGSNQP